MSVGGQLSRLSCLLYILPPKFAQSSLKCPARGCSCTSIAPRVFWCGLTGVLVVVLIPEECEWAVGSHCSLLLSNFPAGCVALLWPPQHKKGWCRRRVVVPESSLSWKCSLGCMSWGLHGKVKSQGIKTWVWAVSWRSLFLGMLLLQEHPIQPERARWCPATCAGPTLPSPSMALLPGECPLSARAGAALLPCKPGAAPPASWAGISGLGGAAETPCPPGVLLAV